MRTYDGGVRKRVLAAIERIVNAEAAASGTARKPEITPLDRYSLVTNDPEAAKRVRDRYRRHFHADRVQETKPTTASEDFGSFGAESGPIRLLVRRRVLIPICTRERRRMGRLETSLPITTRVSLR